MSNLIADKDRPHGLCPVCNTYVPMRPSSYNLDDNVIARNRRLVIAGHTPGGGHTSIRSNKFPCAGIGALPGDQQIGEGIMEIPCSNCNEREAEIRTEDGVAVCDICFTKKFGHSAFDKK